MHGCASAERHALSSSTQVGNGKSKQTNKVVHRSAQALNWRPALLFQKGRLLRLQAAEVPPSIMLVIPGVLTGLCTTVCSLSVAK